MRLLLDGDCVYTEAAEFHIVTWVTAGTVLGSTPWLSEVPRGRVLSSDPQVLVGLHWERWLSQLLNHLMCGTNQNLVPTCSHLVRVDKETYPGLSTQGHCRHSGSSASLSSLVVTVNQLSQGLHPGCPSASEQALSALLAGLQRRGP